MEVVLEDADGSVDESGRPTYRAMYRVTTDSKNNGPASVLIAAGIPSRGDTWQYGTEIDIATVLRRKTCKLRDTENDLTIWEVICEYDRNWDTEGPTFETASDPTQAPAEWSGGLVPYTRKFDKNRDGEALKNSAGDPVKMNGQDSQISVICQKNFDASHIGVLQQYKDALNSSQFWGFGPKRVKVASLKFKQIYWQDIPFVQSRLEVMVTHSTTATWDTETQFLDEGFYELENSERVRIKDKCGSPVAQKWPLNGSGVALTDAQIAADGEVYQDSKIYKLADLNQLGFPTVLGAVQ